MDEVSPQTHHRSRRNMAVSCADTLCLNLKVGFRLFLWSPPVAALLADDGADHPPDFHLERPGDFDEGVKRRIGFPVFEMPDTGTAQAGQFGQKILRYALAYAHLHEPQNHGIDNRLIEVGTHSKTLPACLSRSAWP